MKTFCFHHLDNEAHDPGPDHSERSARLTKIIACLKQAHLPEFEWQESPLGQRDDIARVHTQDYIDYVFRSVPKEGYRQIEINEVVSEGDAGEVTTLCPLSGNAVMRSIGGVTAAIDTIMKGNAKNAFCATRPPGHHALTNKSMGFCIFNNAAIAARYTQAKHGLKKIAIVDFDVHHGNGTQQIFENDASVFFASIHQLPLWPESGRTDEVGAGNILNVPTAPNIPRREWLDIWRSKVLARLQKESFEFLIISAGFDAHKDDPKGEQNLDTKDYYDITNDLLKIAKLKCGGHVISVLEGGYDIDASAASAVEHVRALCAA